jgi:RNA polymerase sigma-70 factor, ECF subfamily
MSTATMPIEPLERPRTTTCRDDGTIAFCAVRRRLLGVAQRIVRDRAEAEDVVQDAWLRWQLADRTTVANPTAFLVTTTTRLALNAVQSARCRRETSVGQWFPEPVATGDDPALGPERRDSLEAGVVVLLERLTPVERAAFVLHEAFDYAYPHIAGLLQISEANARQLVCRARKHVTSDRRQAGDAGEHRRLLHAFVAAARHGDVQRLEQLFAADVMSTSERDGDTRRRVARCAAAMQAASGSPH